MIGVVDGSNYLSTKGFMPSGYIKYGFSSTAITR